MCEAENLADLQLREANTIDIPWLTCLALSSKLYCGTWKDWTAFL
jgi:hypothetical protein